LQIKNHNFSENSTKKSVSLKNIGKMNQFEGYLAIVARRNARHRPVGRRDPSPPSLPVETRDDVAGRGRAERLLGQDARRKA